MGGKGGGGGGCGERKKGKRRKLDESTQYPALALRWIVAVLQ